MQTACRPVPGYTLLSNKFKSYNMYEKTTDYVLCYMYMARRGKVTVLPREGFTDHTCTNIQNQTQLS